MINRVRFIKHWEDQIAELDEAMKEVEQSDLQGIREEIDLYREIRSAIAELMNFLGDINTLTTEKHRKTGFKELRDAVEARVR